jgi:hypothetical protein
MKDKQGADRHQQKTGGQPGQQQRNQSAQTDRRQEGGHQGGESQQRQNRQPGQASDLEREKAQKGKGSPA